MKHCRCARFLYQLAVCMTIGLSWAAPARSADACKSIVDYQSLTIPGSKVGLTIALNSSTGAIRLLEVNWLEAGFWWDTPQIFSYFKEENKFYFGEPLKYKSGEACKGTGCNPMHSAKTTSSYGVSHARAQIEKAMAHMNVSDPTAKEKVQKVVACALELLERF